MAICRCFKLKQLQRQQKGMVFFSVADPDQHESGVDFGRLDPYLGGQKLPTKIGKKVKKFHVLKRLMFSCED